MQQILKVKITTSIGKDNFIVKVPKEADDKCLLDSIGAKFMELHTCQIFKDTLEMVTKTGNEVVVREKDDVVVKRRFHHVLKFIDYKKNGPGKIAPNTIGFVLQDIERLMKTPFDNQQYYLDRIQEERYYGKTNSICILTRQDPSISLAPVTLDKLVFGILVMHTDSTELLLTINGTVISLKNITIGGGVAPFVIDYVKQKMHLPTGKQLSQFDLPKSIDNNSSGIKFQLSNGTYAVIQLLVPTTEAIMHTKLFSFAAADHMGFVKILRDQTKRIQNISSIAHQRALKQLARTQPVFDQYSALMKYPLIQFPDPHTVIIPPSCECSILIPSDTVTVDGKQELHTCFTMDIQGEAYRLVINGFEPVKQTKLERVVQIGIATFKDKIAVFVNERLISLPVLELKDVKIITDKMAQPVTVKLTTHKYDTVETIITVNETKKGLRGVESNTIKIEGNKGSVNVQTNVCFIRGRRYYEVECTECNSIRIGITGFTKHVDLAQNKDKDGNKQPITVGVLVDFEEKVYTIFVGDHQYHQAEFDGNILNGDFTVSCGTVKLNDNAEAEKRDTFALCF